MSGTPTEAEVRAQWADVIDIVEQSRAFFDGLTGGSQEFDNLYTNLEGIHTPAGLTTWGNDIRSAMSDVIDANRVRSAIETCLFEYAATMGWPRGTADEVMDRLYDHFIDNSYTVESRNITFNSSGPTITGTGNGTLSRLTVGPGGSAAGDTLESCHVEEKTWKCVQDQNSGVKEHEEVFVLEGETRSFDNLERIPGASGGGSGESTRDVITNRHAGSGASGSLCKNSSFSTFDDSQTNEKFSGWAQTYVNTMDGGTVSQDTTNYYNNYPGESTRAALKITPSASTDGDDDITFTQTIQTTRTSGRLENRPYFLRLMFNRSIGGAASGNLIIKIGSKSESVAISAQSGWTELKIGTTTPSDCWFENFNEDGLDIEITWENISENGTNYLLIDDVIFAPWDFADGTFWFLRHTNSATASVAPWVLNDEIAVTDTGGAPTTAKIQYYLWWAGFRSLPSTTGTPTFTEP